MELDEMAKTLVETLHLETNPVGIKLLRSEEEIPKDIKMITEPLRYCEMVQAARYRGETTLAKVDMHSCKGGAAGLGLMEFPENISSGNLYFSKLNKVVTKEAGSKIVSSFPAQKAGSTVATLVAPLDKMPVEPESSSSSESPSRRGGWSKRPYTRRVAGWTSTPRASSPFASMPPPPRS